jgi:hypothetical protein
MMQWPLSLSKLKPEAAGEIVTRRRAAKAANHREQVSARGVNLMANERECNQRTEN